MLLIIAKDPEERRRALEGVLKEETSPPHYFDPEQFDLFFQEVETLPFLTPSKVVVAQEIDRLNQESFERLAHYVSKPNRWISLYLTAASLAPQNRLLKQIERVIRIKEEKAWEKEKRLAEWVCQEAKESGVGISISTAQALVKVVDSSMLKPELEKLICYAGERGEISLHAVQLLSTPQHHETLWQLGEAIFNRQTSLALKLGRALLDEEGGLIPLLVHLRTQFHTLLKILMLNQQGGKEAVLHAFPYLKGGLLEKKISSAQNYGASCLEKGLSLLFEAELKAKNSSIQPYLLLEMLLVKL